FHSVRRAPPRPPLFPYTTLFRSRHPVPGGGGDAANDRRRSQASRGRNRRDRGAAHLGAKPLPPSTHPLHRTGRRRVARRLLDRLDRKSTRLNSSHVATSYAVFCL